MASAWRRSRKNFSAIRRQGGHVNLTDNPIFLTQKRLTHRGGVLAAIVIAALVGFSLVAGLIGQLSEPETFHSRSLSPGKTFYAWTILLEVVVWVLAGFSRISRSLAED